VKSIYKLVAAQRDSYRSDTIEPTEGYNFSQYETLRTVELYDDDRFLTGNKDHFEREKPFFNIVSFRKNVAILPLRPPRPSTSRHCIDFYCYNTEEKTGRSR
jgi:hypothetical protein